MKTAEELKKIVKEKYGEIAEKSSPKKSCCCNGPSDNLYTVFADDYSKLEGYDPNADLNLGCGMPTEFAKIKEGDVVVDLGSGAGNDCFVARAITGKSGKVVGIDFTEKMVEKARKNAAKLGYYNVIFLLGEIEKLPLKENTADVVISNCVMNLVPSKEKAFSETFRILKKGGHFSISDIVLQGKLPEGLKNEAALYAGCVSGAIQKNEYLDVIAKTGFSDIQVQKQKEIDLPEEIYLKYLTRDQWENFKESGSGIFSITVFAEK